jgi:hypothetical protein
MTNFQKAVIDVRDLRFNALQRVLQGGLWRSVTGPPNWWKARLSY